jgi:hypothetical protein
MPEQIYFAISFDNSIEKDLIEFITKNYGHLVEPIDKNDSRTYAPGSMSVYLNLKSQDYTFDNFIKIPGFLKSEPKFISKIEHVVLWFNIFFDSSMQHNYELSSEMLTILGKHIDSFCWSVYDYNPEELKDNSNEL